MMSLEIQDPSDFQISFYSQVCHLMVSIWLLKSQHHIKVPGRKNQVGRTRQEGQNVQTETLFLKELSGMLHPVISAYTSLANIVLHGYPPVREVKCITTMNKTWVLLKEEIPYCIGNCQFLQ